MPFICIICRDNLTPTTELVVNLTEEASGSPEILVTTLCGHLFHKSCLLRGFEATASRLQTAGSRPKGDVCPTCNTPVSARRLVRLYPSEIDDDALANSLKETQELKDELFKLKKENASLKEKLEPQAGNPVMKATTKPFFANLSANPNSQRKTLRASRMRLFGLADSAITQQQAASSSPKIEEQKTIEGGLKVGEKIVWLQIDTPQSGIVKWLGKIDELPYAGIDFDRPIGNQFPESRGKVLFSYTEGHGRLIPIRELILHSDFYVEENQRPEDLALANSLDFEILGISPGWETKESWWH